MSEQEDIKRLYLDPADRDLLRSHLAAERRRLPEGTPPLHGPECYLCVAGSENPDSAGPSCGHGAHWQRDCKVCNYFWSAD